MDLNSGWAFARRKMNARWLGQDGDAGDDDVVELPHCWNATDDYHFGVEYYRGPGSYRRCVEIPEAVRGTAEDIWSLESEGFYGTGAVWLNGRRIAEIDGQYLGFSVEPGAGFRLDGRNIFGVSLTNDCRSHVLPGIKMPDFVLYGGLSGRVWLQRTPGLQLDLRRTRVECLDVTPERAEVDIRFTVVNRSGRDLWCRVEWTLVDPQEKEVERIRLAEMYLESGASSGLLRVRTSVSNPELWSVDSPKLYRAVCSVSRDEEVVDCEAIRFGVRSAEFRPDEGFFLNGERVELRGCNRHESMPGFGRALPACLHGEDARMMKEMGLNFVRLAHYPQSPVFLDACDELGLLVYAEIATWKSVRAGSWLRSAVRQMEDLVRRDRNHPSIIIWGMGNEARSRKAYERLGAMARALDPGRPVTYAENHFYRARREKTTDVADVWGINYDFEALEDGHRASRLKSVIVSECSNFPESFRGDPAKELRQVEMLEKDLAMVAGKPFVAGFALWCWNDYGTLRKGRYRRYSGIVDAWRVPKMSAALLRAMCDDKPFVKVFADWKPAEAGAQREVHVFTNCDSVLISIGGNTVKTVPGRTHIVENVAFQPEELVVEGIHGGGSVRDSIRPYGAACRLQVEVERRLPGGEGLVSLLIRVTDAAGRLVGDWSGDVGVELKGSGRVISYSSDGKIMIAGGVGRCFVMEDHRTGRTCSVDVICRGLQPASVVVL